MNATGETTPDDGGGRKAARREAREAARRKQRTRKIAIGGGVVVFVALAALVLMSLGGEDAPLEPSASVTVEATDHAYSPDPVLALAGEVEIYFENKGLTGHELILLQEGQRITHSDQFDESIQLTKIPSIASGTNFTGTITLEPGTYQMICLLPGHFEAGMDADLIVS